MSKRRAVKFKIVAIGLFAAALAMAFGWYFHRHAIAVLAPAGEVAQKERSLIVVALLLSAIVVVPVYVMTVAIVLKYREGNHSKKKITYSPEWDHSRLFESLWWGIPLLIITILSIVTWYSSHALDPFRSLASSKKPLNVQVICLDWKWLFIYPDQHIASVNLVEMPVDTPVNFQITSDAVMNSFWIPRLGGQIYAMPGMSTQLHLVANRAGDFYGSPANIAGSGFARMTFTARAVSAGSFNDWVRAAQASPRQLTMAAYHQLAKPSTSNPVAYYASPQSSLYNDVVMRYMMPTPVDTPAVNTPNTSPSSMPGMSMP
jgi:cytochrome o ubiquinol oxidase subunit II